MRSICFVKSAAARTVDTSICIFLGEASILQEEDDSLIEQTPKRPRSNRDAKEITPARGSPTVYTFGGKERKPNNRSTPQKSTRFQRSNNKRTASRTGKIVMFTKTLHRIKTVTNDDVFVGYRRSEQTVGSEFDKTTYSNTRTLVFHWDGDKLQVSADAFI